MPDPRDPRLLVVAVGGNALRDADGVAAPAEWFRALGRSLPPLVDLVAAGFRLVLTHGNGPQVGDELLRMELARRSVPPLALDLCGAETQGSLGYAIQQVHPHRRMTRLREGVSIESRGGGRARAGGGRRGSPPSPGREASITGWREVPGRAG